MKKRKIVPVLVAVILPLVSYLIVNDMSHTAVVMPKRYFFDTVKTIVVKGKEVPDTVWHKVKLNVNLVS